MLADSLTLSPLADNWLTSLLLTRQDLSAEADIFLRVASHLLANPNLNSTHLYRADILLDTDGILKTPHDKEKEQRGDHTASSSSSSSVSDERVAALPAPSFPGFDLTRTVVRRFIPRNQKLDSPLDQSCYFYTGQEGGHLVVYLPHVAVQDDLPWYHPAVRGIGFLYQRHELSVHFLPFPVSPQIPTEIPTRLERTLLSLLSTHARLVNGTAKDPSRGSKPKPFKDNIVLQHVLQNTQHRLKERYAAGLIANWVEVTEPSKHVFEDIAIAAFLIELWRLVYGVGPDELQDDQHSFPGFVDIACGNGVLVHILLSEGYKGWGFDARHRKTWATLPPSTQDHLHETICLPKPFEDALSPQQAPLDSCSTHDGVFPKGTFIISNHADELTVWTPLLGALSDPSCPLPFVAIPCCSHALSGARCRYPPPKSLPKMLSKLDISEPVTSSQEHPELDPQPPTGDLKALRAAKQNALQDPGSTSSAYGCLTAKVVAIAEELGYDVDKTLLRIPSTRNMAVVGGLKKWTALRTGGQQSKIQEERLLHGDDLEARIQEIVQREAATDGGLEAAAKGWVERSLSLQTNKGKGKDPAHP